MKSTISAQSRSDSWSASDADLRATLAIVAAGEQPAAGPPTEGNDSLDGTAGADTISGLGGNDTINGLNGDDTLNGGNGNDYLRGQGGDDSVNGGAGADTIEVGAASILEVIDGGDGFDTLYVNGTGGGTAPALLYLPTSIKGIEAITFGPTVSTGSIQEVVFAYQQIGTTIPADLTVTGSANSDQIVIVASGGGTFSVPTGFHFINWTQRDLSNLSVHSDDIVLVASGNQSFTLNGSAVSDVLYGGDGNDTLNGGAGNDFLLGRAGDTTYHGGDGDDILAVATHLGGEPGGTFLEVSSATLVDGGTGVDVLGFNSTLLFHGTVESVEVIGFDNVLASTFETDIGTLQQFGNANGIGVEGPDGIRQELIVDMAAPGNADLSRLLFFHWTAADPTADHATGNLDFLTVNGSAGNDTIVGSSVRDAVNGAAGNDALNGKGGADLMSGGLGNDSFSVDDAGDKIIEAAGEGTDTIYAAVSFTLQAGQSVELLATTSTAGAIALNLVGNELDQAITGNAGDNQLFGLAGDDTLSGFGGRNQLYGGVGDDQLISNGGIDTLSGAAGNDLYRIDSASDVVSEATGQGTDTILASFSFALAGGISVEALAAGDAAAIASLGLVGNELAQTLTGNAGNNSLNGGGGADTLIGLAGNDGYNVDNAGDRVTEAAGAGTDTVYASVSYTLGAGQSVDVLSTTSGGGTMPLQLTGNEFGQLINGNAGNNILFGLDGNDTIYGYGGVNQLYGGAGDDILVSRGGADTLSGALGNDAYQVDSAGDVVQEAAGSGTDTVYAFTSYTLGAGQSVEVFGTASLAGTAPIALTGNALAQTINGNSGANVIIGGGGGDVLNGYGGNDRITGDVGRDVIDGGAGNDVIVFAALSHSTGVGRDLVLNADLARDKFDFTVTPTAIDATVTHGALSTASFDANLGSAIGASQLAAHHAVLFDPDSGNLNLAGHLFLVVDANNVAGYQAGQDYVVELLKASGTLTVDDFA